MSNIESGFIPLPKIEQEQPEDNIEIRLNLPSYVDQDRIGINPTQIRKLSDWGGIRTVRVIGKTGEETSVVIPEVVGMGPDGSALASKKAAKREVAIFDSESRDERQVSTLAKRWVNVRVNLNVDEMAQRVSDSQEGVRAAGEWAKLLDKGIKTPIRTEGHYNLLTGLESSEKSFIGLHTVVGGSFQVLSLVSSGRLALGYFAGAYAASRAFALAWAKTDKDYRFSLSPIQQVDRAAILSVSSRLKTVVKDLHNK